MVDKTERRHPERLHPCIGSKEPMPIPTQVVSESEYRSTPQTQEQRRVEEKMGSLGDELGRRAGLDRRSFLKTSAGMAAGFLAMNSIYGPLFDVDAAEAADLDLAEKRRRELADQFIFDVQLHFVSRDYSNERILELRRYAAKYWNRRIREPVTFQQIQFENFLKEVYLDSDTKLGLLSGAPSDQKEKWFLSNREIAQARAAVNRAAGSKRLYCHFVIWPKHPGWIEAIEEGIAELKPDSWKGYTIGDPFEESDYPWRLDDAELMYPVYEKMLKAGIRNVCIHKGLLPQDYREAFKHTWQYATMDDVGPAARDWPALNFIIYHSGLEFIPPLPAQHIREFERTGRINWVTDLAEIPARYGVSNVYAEVGSTFAASVISYPRHAAGILGTLVRGMGVDHVLWGTDSVWYGSPQWQIEALRRIRMPDDLQERFGFPDLGGADSPPKRRILGENAAGLYGLSLESFDKAPGLSTEDHFTRVKGEYEGDRPKQSSRFSG